MKKKKEVLLLAAAMFMLSASTGKASDGGAWLELTDTGNIFTPKAWVYVEPDGTYSRSWKEIEGKWYFFEEATGYMYQERWAGNYYLGSDGAMEKDTWIVEKIGSTPNLTAYYTGADGAWVKDAVYPGLEGSWEKDSKGWRYQDSEGSYDRDMFEYIDNAWYCFDKDGYMVTGLLENAETGALHYFREDGSLAINSGWIEIEQGKWIYVSGKQCVTAGITPDGYQIDETGIYISK